MAWLKNLTFKFKLLLLVSISMMAMVFFSANQISEKRQIASSMAQVVKLVELSTKISALVHETQKERGRTAGFIGSQGVQFKTELVAQRSISDEKSAELAAFLSDFPKIRIWRRVPGIAGIRPIRFIPNRGNTSKNFGASTAHRCSAGLLHRNECQIFEHDCKRFRR
ncbi:MAG: nitrate- and nitrite sensing domain-containing protein [Calditrichia bacterium]